ncbi:hypothetical protein AB0J28_00695 [Streptosporangium canum]|uniref:hypothetical protein n=1 Tax=Streptosporangium canum TaxID=324952 RepID=UPI0034174974
MTIRTLALASATTSLQDHRLTLGAFMAPGASALERRSGISYYPGAADLVSASALQANVTPFIAIVDGTSNALQGQILVVIDANELLTFSAGEAAVSRTDRVVLQVRDNSFDASGSTDARVVVVKGNTSTGAANAVPASSLLLWEVTVPIGASSITFSSARTDRRVWAGTMLRIPVNSQAERNALPAVPGLEVTRLDTGNVEQYWSGAWRTMGPAAAPTRILVNNQSERDALAATSGLEVTRLDTGNVEQYWSGSWRVLAPVLPGAQFSFVKKTSDTARTSNATLTDDPHLVAAVLANSSYVFEFLIRYFSPESVDFQMSLSMPAGALAYAVSWDAPASSMTGTSGDRYFGDGGPNPIVWFGGGSGYLVARITGLLETAGTAGNLTFRWAQGSSSASSTTVGTASFIRLHKVL